MFSPEAHLVPARPPASTETFEEDGLEKSGVRNNIFLGKKERQETSDVSREEEEGGLLYPFS